MRGSSQCLKWLVRALILCGVGCGGGGTVAATANEAKANLSESISELITSTDDTSANAAAASVERAVKDIDERSTDEVEASARVNEAVANVIVDPERLDALDRISRELGGLVVGKEMAGALTGKEPPEPTSCDTTVCVVYVNGVAVDYVSFCWSVICLKRLVDEAIHGAHTGGVYNTSATDKEKSQIGQILCPFGSGLDALAPLCDKKLGVLIDLGEAGIQLFGRFGSTPLIGVGQAQKIAETISGYAERGSFIIVVCHSQGAFFTRDALVLLAASSPDALSRIAVIMVGSPESRIAIGGRFIPDDRVAVVQIKEDLIARLGDPDCRECVPSPLGFEVNFFKHHYFETYLTSKPRERIIDALATLHKRLALGSPLEAPTPEAPTPEPPPPENGDYGDFTPEPDSSGKITTADFVVTLSHIVRNYDSRVAVVKARLYGKNRNEFEIEIIVDSPIKLNVDRVYIKEYDNDIEIEEGEFTKDQTVGPNRESWEMVFDLVAEDDGLANVYVSLALEDGTLIREFAKLSLTIEDR